MQAFQLLKLRGLISQFTPSIEEGLKVLGSDASVYLGIDPTGDGLHIGHYLTARVLKSFLETGAKGICLVGGATAQIGDPSGKSVERPLLDYETIAKNTKGITDDLALLGLDSKNVRVVNNLEWYKDMGMTTFLRDIGRNVRVNSMLNRDSVVSRLNSSSGLSFTEFTYQILQAYDYYYLHSHYNCVLQVGGNDQWGNITAGCELIRKLSGHVVNGVTVPLVTTSNGQKIGKSAGNCVYLSSQKTSDYSFYQYFYNLSDEDGVRLLPYFTYLSDKDIKELREEHQKCPENRILQKEIAKSLLTELRGNQAYEKAINCSDLLFKRIYENVSIEEIEPFLNDIPSIELNKSETENKKLVDTLYQCGLAKSKKEIQRLIKTGGISLNNQIIKDPMYILQPQDIIDGKWFYVKRGKRQVLFIKLK